jgi:dihydroorotate dehydrogenase electron transfer subunit
MKYALLTNRQIAKHTHEISLAGDTSAFRAPGQFVNIKIDGFFLRRPLSVADLEPGKITLIFKIVGGGTAALAQAEPGAVFDMLTGLGNGFDINAPTDAPLLVGGGVGVPPLYYLLKQLIAGGKRPTAILGFNTREEVFYAEQFGALCPTVITTADGSIGTRGFVTDAMEGIDYDYFYACGPEPMLEAVAKRTHTPGELSFEARMACGFGACMGCSKPTKDKNMRICIDGPVLKKEALIW